MRSFVLLLPMTDDIVVIGLTGSQLLEALENGVSAYPRTEGRFPIVSGVRFQFLSTSPPGSRVVKESVTVNDVPLDLTKEYSVATKLYLATGKDGYNCFAQGRTIVGETEASILPNIIRNRFLMMGVVEAFKVAEDRSHRAQEVICKVFKRRGKKVNTGEAADMEVTPSEAETKARHENTEHDDSGHVVKKSKQESSPSPSNAGSSGLVVTESRYKGGHLVGAPVSRTPSPASLAKAKGNSTGGSFNDDLDYLERSDSELDLGDCFVVVAHVDGRITRID